MSDKVSCPKCKEDNALMTKVIEFPIANKDNEKEGYLLDDNGNISSVYTANISGDAIGDHAMISTKPGAEITVNEMNTFCIMWLCIFNPEVIKEDD